MSDLVIVAIPREDDPVWRISSEKVPHLTLLYLGPNRSNETRIAEFLEHAASNSLTRFGLQVDYRGKLGEEEADVVFFKGWELPNLKNFRSQLLKNDNIKKAYDSVDQFPEFLPHLTLGYPTKPAKKDNREYPGIHYVDFDRIALWTSDYEGPTFRLKDFEYDFAEVSMSSESAAAGQSAVERVLQHYGVLGMRWGFRKDRSTGQIKKSGRTKASGEPSEDARAASAAKAKAASGGTASLSNTELQSLINRINLEQNYSRLNPTPTNPVKKFIKNQMKSIATQQVSALMSQAATVQVNNALKKAADNAKSSGKTSQAKLLDDILKQRKKK